MDAKGEDTLVQIQKYKAMLSSKRTKAEETEVPVKDEQPKKNKKSFLRTISSKSLKTKKEVKTEEEPRKEEISAPLTGKENQTRSEEVDPKTAEGSEDLEKPSKKKKSVLNLKLPKALKWKKMSEHKVTAEAEKEKEIEKNEPLTEGAEKEKESEKNEPLNEEAEAEKEIEKDEPLTEGAEAEKEIEKDEMLTKENIKQAEEVDETYEQDENQYWKESCEDFYQIENVQPSVEIDKAIDNSEYREGGENTEDEEAYSFYRSLMNDIIKQLKDMHIQKLEQLRSEEEEIPCKVDDDQTKPNETLSSMVEELNNAEDREAYSNVCRALMKDVINELTSHIRELEQLGSEEEESAREDDDDQTVFDISSKETPNYERKKGNFSHHRRLLPGLLKKRAEKQLVHEERIDVQSYIYKEEDTLKRENVEIILEEDETIQLKPEKGDSMKNEESRHNSDSDKYGKFLPNSFIVNSVLEMLIGSKTPNDTENNPSGHTNTEYVYKLVLQTADQTYSTLVNLVNAFLSKAGQTPKQVLVNVLVYLIKKYPQCFKIKKIKRRRRVIPDKAVTVKKLVAE